MWSRSEIRGPLMAGLMLVAISLGFAGSTDAGGEVTRTQQEIDHLMRYIAASDCRFIRNGKAYDPQAAREHIQKKYDYLQSRIRSAEDFIHHAASRSSMSGAPYLVDCGQKPTPCADWLHAELARFRRRTGNAD